jgi:hypothetical protein
MRFAFKELPITCILNIGPHPNKINLTTSPSALDFDLEKPYHYHTWFAKIQGSVPKDLWKYFDFERNDEFHQPEPVKFDRIREGAQNLTGAKTISELLKEEAKLRERVMNSNSDTKES